MPMSIIKPIIKCRQCGATYEPNVESPSLDVLTSYFYTHPCDIRFPFRRGIGDIIGYFGKEEDNGSSGVQDSDVQD
jgi:hypothetical protein